MVTGGLDKKKNLCYNHAPNINGKTFPLYFAMKKETDKEIDYELLSQHYRYDVKLRRALHKIIAFTEIAMRAAVCNAYPNVVFTSRNWKNRIASAMGRPFETGKQLSGKITWYVQKLENEGKNDITLFDLLENSDLQVLNAVFLMLDEDKQREVFTNDFEHLKDNLDAMRELRNCVRKINLSLASAIMRQMVDF